MGPSGRCPGAAFALEPGSLTFPAAAFSLESGPQIYPDEAFTPVFGPLSFPAADFPALLLFPRAVRTSPPSRPLLCPRAARPSPPSRLLLCPGMSTIRKKFSAMLAKRYLAVSDCYLCP
ncbi:hypothetical protein NQZ68_013147 [Dissostichus eleginoides]|nr:hypothetical protein NQZ68_013147 [Dissostichus eleginoides]